MTPYTHKKITLSTLFNRTILNSVLTLILLFSICQINAQSTIDLSGKVLDEKQKGVDLALVSLFNFSDSSFVKSCYSDEDGSFVMTKVAEGNYRLQINLLGYKEHKQTLQLSASEPKKLLPTIEISTDANLLEAVTVKAKTPYIERKIDRTVINPGALISNSGSNALEALERAPGIVVDSDGSLMLKGRSGVTVFINDKPSYLSGTELENYLRSLPAGSVQRIEIMENPPAKYEAAGNSGVINIILKRNKLLGFHGNVSLGLRQGQYTNSNNSLNLNFNKNKVSFYTNIYGGFYNSFQDLNINRYYKDDNNETTSSFSQNTYNKREGKYFNAKVGVDLYPNDKTTVGFSYKVVDSPTTRDNENTSLISDANEQLSQRVIADNLGESTFSNGIYNGYVRYLIDTLGSTISFDADFLRYNSGNIQDFKNFIYNPSDELTYADQIKGDIPSTIDIYAAKTDFEKPFKDGTKIEAGLKTAFTKTDNEAIYSNTVDGVTTPDYELSNQFLYDEWINAAYLNYNRSFGKLRIQAGLRAETTNLKGNQLGNVQKPDSSFTRTYTSLFSTFYASTPLDSTGNNSLTFSYGRRINRPYFQDLNPFISPFDRFTFYGGNPDLLPTFSHNLSLSHSYKGILNTAINYSKTTDNISETLEIRDEVYYSRPGNLASSQSLTLSVDASLPVTPWYRINTYGEVGHLRFKSQLYTEQLDVNDNYYYFSMTNNFQLGKGWGLQISGRYISDIISGQLIVKSYGLINFGLQKKILDGKGNIKLAVNDILYTRRGDGIINNLQRTDADWNSKFDSRNVAINFSYRFGKNTSTKKKYNSSGSDNEQRRVKS